MYGERCREIEGINGFGLEKAGCDIPRWNENKDLRRCFIDRFLSFPLRRLLLLLVSLAFFLDYIG